MRLKIAAIRSGTEPLDKLPGGAMHRWLNPPLTCPHCEVTYNLVADWDASNDRFFERESASLIQALRKAVLIGHATRHRVTHYETGGVTVRSLTPEDAPKPSA